MIDNLVALPAFSQAQLQQDMKGAAMQGSQLLQLPHLEALHQGAVARRVLRQPSGRPHIIAQPVCGRLRATGASRAAGHGQ